MKHIYILIPKLLSPLALWQKDFGFQPESTVLSQLLAFSKRQKTQTRCLASTLFKQLNFPDNTELPIAYYRYLLDFGQAPDGPIMCADPVNLQAGIDEIILNPEPVTDLSKTDIDMLFQALNQHFAQDNWEFIVSETGNGYLKYQFTEHIQTSTLQEVCGKSIFQYLPKSSNLNWHVLQNEIQMLLHINPLNQNRELAGRLPINSLWFWGAGKKHNVQHSVEMIYSNESLAKITAVAANIPQQTLDKLPKQLVSHKKQIIVLDQLYQPAVQDHYQTWQDTLQELESHYINFIANYCKRHKIQLFINDCEGNEFIIKTERSWKFWKKKHINLYNLAV